MIDCEIHGDGNEDNATIGGAFTSFSFNTLPSIGDILWLQSDMGVQISVTVVFVAQWCSSIIENNRGYLIVKIN